MLSLHDHDQWRRLISRLHGNNSPSRPRRKSADRAAQPADRAAPPSLNVVLKLLLIGMQDEASPLSKLGGHRELIDLIYETLKGWWASVLAPSVPADTPAIDVEASWNVAAVSIGKVAFPAYTGAYCNMMPIVLPSIREAGMQRNEGSHCAHSVPDAFKQYLPLIRSCPLAEEDEGTIGYLTVHESYVQEGSAQRRPGLHTESPGAQAFAAAGSGEWAPPPHPGALTFFWGGGHCLVDPRHDSDKRNNRSYGVLSGGIYMASSVGGSCRLWPTQVTDEAAIGLGGDIEHLRGALLEGHGAGASPAANELVWMTDKTPHESMPLRAGTKRQYFRLVTSKVSGWFSRHSTPNPLGVVPGPEVTIIEVDKFEALAAEARGRALAALARASLTAATGDPIGLSEEEAQVLRELKAAHVSAEGGSVDGDAAVDAEAAK